MLNKVFIIILFMAASVFGSNTEKEVSVTVYNSNLGVIKENRLIQIPKGISDISIVDVAQFIDPTSVSIKLNGEVLEQNYKYDLVSFIKILNRYVDKEIELINENGDLISGKLLSAFGGQIVLKKKSGGLLMLPGIGKYQISVNALPKGLITKPTLLWKVDSPQSGKQNVEVSYQTSNMNWHAEYVAVLNEKDTKASLNSWVSIDNRSGKTYDNATLKLVAGDVHRVYDRGFRDEDLLSKRKPMSESVGQFQEKSFFEYHIYNLQRKTTLANNETKQVSLFSTENVGVAKKYLFSSSPYKYQNNGKVAVIIEFNNSKSNNLGMPMPKGKVRVYKSDGSSVEFIGEDLIDHTPKNELVKIKIGDAFDIIGKEKQLENKKITNRVYEKVFEITLTNRKDDDVVVEVNKFLGNFWEILKTNFNYSKIDSDNIKFDIPIKADSKTKLIFKVRYTY